MAPCKLVRLRQDKTTMRWNKRKVGCIGKRSFYKIQLSDMSDIVGYLTMFVKFNTNDSESVRHLLNSIALKPEHEPMALNFDKLVSIYWGLCTKKPESYSFTLSIWHTKRRLRYKDPTSLHRNYKRSFYVVDLDHCWSTEQADLRTRAVCSLYFSISL